MRGRLQSGALMSSAATQVQHCTRVLGWVAEALSRSALLSPLLHWQVDSLPLSHQGSLFKRTSFLKWKRSFNRESREVVLLVKSVPGNQPTSKSNTLSFLPR